MAIVLNQGKESIVGKVLRFTFNKPGIPDKYFEVERADRSKCFCKGTVIPGKDILIGSTLKLFGEWKVNENPKYVGMGLQFYFTTYDIVKPGRLDKVIRRSKGASPPIKSTAISEEVSERVAGYLETIGHKKITYEFNEPKHATIASHVKAQLNERILRATRDDKDFFFLTALLDRRVEDQRIQTFRKDNRNFKKDLLRCWKEAEGALEGATGDIGRALTDADIRRAISDRSPAYRSLLASIPGDHGIDQLLACLKIIRDRYDRNGRASIADFVRDIKSEREIKEYLRGIRGIGPKLDRWSLTNVTGHWFVIDTHITRVIEKDLRNTLPDGMSILAENADAIFECWFGSLDEMKKEYTKFSQSQFASIFKGFRPEACERLPFIVTQTLWFYGKYCMT